MRRSPTRDTTVADASLTSSAAFTAPPANPVVETAPSTPVEATRFEAAPAPEAPIISRPEPQATRFDLHTEAGWQTARAEVGSSAQLDEPAVASYQRALNEGAAKQGQYITPELAQWDMERRGMLPTQREENARRVDAYMAQNGVSANEAYNALNESRGLAQHEVASTPKPPSFASKQQADYVYTQYTQEVQTAKAQGREAMPISDFKVKLETQGKLPK